MGDGLDDVLFINSIDAGANPRKEYAFVSGAAFDLTVKETFSIASLSYPEIFKFQLTGAEAPFWGGDVGQIESADIDGDGKDDLALFGVSVTQVMLICLMARCDF